MNKLIEGIISDICPFLKNHGSCERCNTELDIDNEPCYWECIANAIIKYGYRRQDEVASKIISEIEQAIMAHGTNYALKRLEEIKKGYGII